LDLAPEKVSSTLLKNALGYYFTNTGFFKAEIKERPNPKVSRSIKKGFPR